MRIQHNIAALNSHRNLTGNNSAVSKNLEKLSSGYRINRAGDDAAGLAVSEKMRAQITGLQTATKNAEDGISLVQTAEGALTEVHSMLNRMVELATQSANGTYEDKNRVEMQKEITALQDEIDRISKTANFNNQKLFTGGVGDAEEPDAPAETPVTVAEATSTAITNTPGSTTDEAQYSFDFAGIGFDKDGTVTVNIGDVAVDVDVTADMDAGAFAGAFADAFNAAGKSDSVAGAFVATATGSGVSIVAENKGVEAENIFGATAPTDFSVTGKAVPAQQAEDADGADGAGEADADAEPLNIKLHVGETSSEENQITVKINAMSSHTLGVDAEAIDVTDQDAARTSITKITDAIDLVSGIRSDLGALQNRLEHTINNLGVQTENITAAESRIRDVDMAKEMMTYTKNNILVQASQAMLAQANQVPQGVLQLLQ